MKPTSQASENPVPTGGQPAEALPGGRVQMVLLNGIASTVPDWETRLLRAAALRDSLCQLTLGMGHELNNLVGGISALSEIYLQGIESGLPLKDGLGLIHNSASRLQILLRQLTGINRPAEGARDYVNLVEMVHGDLAMFSHVLPKSVRLDVALPDEELAVLLDETALRQLLLNLILNLRDALGRERAAGTLKISMTRLLGERPRAELRLSGEPAADRDFPAETDQADAWWLDSQVRLLDARQAVQELGGTFEIRDGAVILSLPLIA